MTGPVRVIELHGGRGQVGVRHFTIRKGEWPSLKGAPTQRVADVAIPQSSAFLGLDAPGLRPRFDAAEGDLVAEGQALFRDRRHPEIVFAASMSGRVQKLAHGPRRTLSACIIVADKAAPPPLGAAAPDDDSPGALRDTLLARGLWPAFRTRPFGRIPRPQDKPDAIFVNAVPSSPLAPDPMVVLGQQDQAFQLGTSLLTRLTDGDVFVCQAPGEPICSGADGVILASFSGTIAAGLASTHIDRLFPVGLGRRVWTIGYQDVIAIGHLYLTGRYAANRVVSVAGPAAETPRLLQTCLGANIGDICGPASARALSGDEISGRDTLFLGRFHDQITVPAANRGAPVPAWISRHFHRQGALVPTRQLDRALALDVLTVPLLRALGIGDSEAAQRLGCLALVEEDLAAVSHRCTSGADYGALLRDVLDDLMAETA